mmetsp:Transcript_27090/g.76227  ORF Transcript_27090/g.76227 Transcript_27090/m.76227 type:complete len:267 (-) Transcript_27090:848-1648(-)
MLAICRPVGLERTTRTIIATDSVVDMPNEESVGGQMGIEQQRFSVLDEQVLILRVRFGYDVDGVVGTQRRGEALVHAIRSDLHRFDPTELISRPWIEHGIVPRSRRMVQGERHGKQGINAGPPTLRCGVAWIQVGKPESVHHFSQQRRQRNDRRPNWTSGGRHQVLSIALKHRHDAVGGEMDGIRIGMPLHVLRQRSRVRARPCIDFSNGLVLRGLHLMPAVQNDHGIDDAVSVLIDKTPIEHLVGVAMHGVQMVQDGHQACFHNR